MLRNLVKFASMELNKLLDGNRKVGQLAAKRPPPPAPRIVFLKGNLLGTSSSRSGVMLLTFVAHVNDPKIPDIPLFLKLIIVVTLYRALVALLAACAPAEFSLSCLCTICTSQVPNAQHLGHLYSCRHQSEKWP